ncbi:sensor histidine kinase [Hymenobacter bucti]|uniref:Sensor histidine kinase n=1 Tax=Hymenobacter bucti TaxID=1844114 RepID=A0ABW4QN48_9BACT
MQKDTVRPSRFPLVFEALIWVIYVGLYKYSACVNQVPGHPVGHPNFPYPHLCVYAFLITLYAIPYYRWLMPQLLQRRRYWLLLLLTLLYFWQVPNLETGLVIKLFRYLASHGFNSLSTLPRYWGSLDLPTTDLIAFSCVAFVRVAFESETRRRQIEKEHAALQLEQLKAQLQPHFLFNTLNSIYGLSLAGSPETPRFILLLSELMRYVLYDSGKEYIKLADEVTFLKNYFELEQRKYEGASIRFTASGADLGARQVPPLLWLPLVENSFKHGRHHFSDDASVEATLTAAAGTLRFVVENDMLPSPPPATPRRSGGIGLENIKRRLQLYYPGTHELHLTEHAGRYRAELILHV